MGSLFEQVEVDNLKSLEPLATRMRPRSVGEFVGQEHVLGHGKLLRRMLDADRLASIILYGPPGCGKTSLAEVIARHTRSRFVAMNATTASVKDVRQVIEEAENQARAEARRTVLFLDEIHRFNRAQQDVLLPALEHGFLVLVGATTENPFFACTGPLLSRSQVFKLEPLSSEDLVALLRLALADAERGLGSIPVQVEEGALELLAELAGGDARRALNALEIAVLSCPERPVKLTARLVRECVQRRYVPHDRAGDVHYDVVSAFIKSMRGSDPDAAVYWLARMLEGGEDPRFIARRIVICAAEDVGNADPNALVVANAAAQATEFVGLPECELILSQAAIYVATAPKSNASATAIWNARADIRSGVVLDVPVHLRDAHYAAAARLGHGKGYLYPHDDPSGYVPQEYLPEPRIYYKPVSRGYEREIARRLHDLRSSAADQGDNSAEERATRGTGCSEQPGTAG